MPSLPCYYFLPPADMPLTRRYQCFSSKAPCSPSAVIFLSCSRGVMTHGLWPPPECCWSLKRRCDNYFDQLTIILHYAKQRIALNYTIIENLIGIMSTFCIISLLPQGGSTYLLLKRLLCDHFIFLRNRNLYIYFKTGKTHSTYPLIFDTMRSLLALPWFVEWNVCLEATTDWDNKIQIYIFYVD